MLWSWWLGDPLMSAPTIAKGRVFAAYPAANGRACHKEASHLLGAFDLKSGKILWQRWMDGDVISAPVAVGDEVIAASFTGTVFRFKQDTGQLTSAVKSRATSAPVVVGGEMHFSRRMDKSGSAQEALVVWERGDSRGSGARYANVFGGKSAPYLDKTIQEAAELKETGVKLDAGNGFAAGAPSTAKAEPAASNVGQGNVATLQSYQGSRILRYGATSIACMGDEVVCSDPKLGKLLWSLKLKGDLKKQGGYLGAPPVATAQSVFMSTLAGEILCLDPKTGDVRKTWDLGHPMRYPPVVENGRVYVGTHDGRIISIETGDIKETGWPQWGRDAQRTGTP
jgi:outer membrane protein assembly factor BamB